MKVRLTPEIQSNHLCQEMLNNTGENNSLMAMQNIQRTLQTLGEDIQTQTKGEHLVSQHLHWGEYQIMTGMEIVFGKKVFIKI